MARVAGIPKMPTVPTGPVRPPTAIKPVMKPVTRAIMGVRPDAAPAAHGRAVTMVPQRRIAPVKPIVKPVLKPVPGGTVKRFTDPSIGASVGAGIQHDDMIHPGQGVPGSVPGGVPVPGAATPAPPDLSALIAADPRMLARMGVDRARMQNALGAQYGVNPATGAAFTEAENPNSAIAGAHQGFRANMANLQNQLNASGILFSGANVAGTNALERARDAGVNQALGQYQSGLNEFDQGTSDLSNTIYSDLLGQAGTLTPDPAKAAGGTTGGGAGSPPAGGAAGAAARVAANQKANAALAKTTGLTALANLYNASKGKVDTAVMAAIDAKLKAARAKGKK